MTNPQVYDNFEVFTAIRSFVKPAPDLANHQKKSFTRFFSLKLKKFNKLMKFWNVTWSYWGEWELATLFKKILTSNIRLGYFHTVKIFIASYRMMIFKIAQAYKMF